MNTPATKEWQETMTDEEVRFLHRKFNEILSHGEYGSCINNFRAARLWKSSQRRRYMRDRDHGCCGFFDTIVEKWNWEKLRHDKYMLGFNYGH